MNVAGSISIGKHNAVLAQLGDGEPTSLREARAVIEGIRAEKGYLDAETMQDLGSMRAQSRDYILRIIQRNRETEAAYTMSISEQLYSSKYRFLYEVIQNADDSRYDLVQKIQGSQPFVRFSVTPLTFVIETNEDGFTRKNVEAICATGKSSKKLAKDSTGEKGFGFKSVFAVADEVRIQSGLWSFRFEHRQGDDGLGMVTPLDAPLQDLPEGVTTRISLRLTPDVSTDFRRLLDAITNIPDTTLLFLRRLSKIFIEITHLDSRIESVFIQKSVDSSMDTVHISRSGSENGVEQPEQIDASLYHIFSHTVAGMPTDARRKDQSSVCVDLAFPVDPASKQIKLCDKGQHIFAYLPLQRLQQLQFLIQADFIASASRETIIDCAWNEAICSGIAVAFVKAVEAFATTAHPLRYSWLDYMPFKPIDHPWEQLGKLYTLIVDLLKTKPVLETWEQRRFKTPAQLRQIPWFCMFENEPLLGDLDDEVYIAFEYRHRRSRTLEDLGVACMSWEELIARIQADLTKQSSRIRTYRRDSLWYEAFAYLGLRALEARPKTQDLFKRQALLCLSRPNQWTGAPNMGSGGLPKIYFPMTESISIPEDVGLHLADRTASANAKVRELYTALGVAECPKEVVFSRIRDAHMLEKPIPGINAHLRYLFHMHKRPEDLRAWLLAPTDNGLCRSGRQIYFSSQDEHDLDQLLPRDVRLRSNLACNMLPANILTLEPVDLRVHQRTWQEWIQYVFDARYYPALTSRGSFGPYLHPDLRVLLSLNPSKFLSTLRAHWGEYRDTAPSIRSELRDCKVLCKSKAVLPLHTTFLPTSQVLGRLRELDIDDTKIPVLELPDRELDDALIGPWRFLEEFGVSSKSNLRFYQLALKEMSLLKDASVTKAKSLYKSMAQLATIDDQTNLRTFFKDERYIRGTDDWLNIDECVWNGPDFLLATTVLASCYVGDNYLKSFFTTTLDITNASFHTVLDDLFLWMYEDAEFATISRTRQVYEYLEKNVHSDVDWATVKEHFGVHKLVLDQEGKWHGVDTCFWNSPFPLAGYVDLQATYPSLEKFFVKKLKVKKVSPTMLIREMKKMAEQNAPDIEAIRSHLIGIGTILAKCGIDVGSAEALKELRKVNFFPKRQTDGRDVLVSVEDDYAILDHERYGTALATHGVLLNFGIDETQILHVVFQHLGLTSRYLSVAVAEESSVGDPGIEDQELSRQLQDRAYALYCCAARYKSRKALRNDRTLFDQISTICINTTDDITTELSLQLRGAPIKVHSDRSNVHYTVIDGRLTIYVPKAPQQRRICYRSQLPKLLAIIIGADAIAHHDIANIVSCRVNDLDDILQELDIADVTWIPKPRLELTEPWEDEEPQSLVSGHRDYPNDETIPRRELSVTLNCARSGLRAASVPLEAVEERSTHARVSTPSISQQQQYCQLVEQLFHLAQSVTYEQSRTFNSFTTFGGHETDDFSYNRRIGAAGEAFVFERLASLNLPDFSLTNWLSTIRGAVNIHPRYATLQDWVGRETTDLVYIDRLGLLTQYLRNNCTGGFPAQIAVDHDHALQPIEYYLEVKSTPGSRNTRFYMSNGQYTRMQDMAQGLSRGQWKVYVILRISNLVQPAVDVDIFVDPFRLKGDHLDFESEKWFVKIR